jgi:hypothetical protein
MREVKVKRSRMDRDDLGFVVPVVRSVQFAVEVA